MLDPVKGTAPPHVDYSATIDKDTRISLVGKSTTLARPTPGGSTIPQTVGVGQMKLEAPPRYSGKRQLGVSM